MSYIGSWLKITVRLLVMPFIDCQRVYEEYGSVDNNYFSFPSQTCVTLFKSNETNRLSQILSNEHGSNKQCNCICYQNFIIISYTPFIMLSLFVAVVLISVVNLCFKNIRTLS